MAVIMPLKIFLLLVLVTSQASCEKGSLTFVIDDTMSMADDINQVRTYTNSHADNIFRATSIEDVVVVTFNDPDTKFVTRTRNAQELAHALDSIKVHGGGDCPEMALSGIKRALEESRPKSNLFVFTDASAKDYQMFEQVKALCKEKESQITFLLTGKCYADNSEMNSVYDNLAAACNGQTLRISKSEISQAIDNALKQHLDQNARIQVFPPNEWSEIKFTKDHSIDYVTVFASGDNVELDVVDEEQRHLLTKESQIMWDGNVKIVKMKKLPNGKMTMRVRATSEVSFGFSRKSFEESGKENN